MIFVFGQQHPEEQQDEIFTIPLIFKVETLLSVLWAAHVMGQCTVHEEDYNFTEFPLTGSAHYVHT